MARRRLTKAQRTRQIYIRVCLVCALVSFALVGLYIFLLSASKIKVDLNEKTHITLSGFNGDGVLEATLDADDSYSTFFDSVEVEFSKGTELSNGDEVTISYKYDKSMAKKYNLKVIATDMHYTVQGLIDPVNVSKEDIFEGVNVTFSGIAPLCEAKLEVKNNKFDEAIDFAILGDETYYDVGDVVRVQAVYNDEMLATLNCVTDVATEECIKEFRVEGVDRYATSAEDITDDMLASLKKEALSFFTDANEYGMRIFCDAGLIPVYINKKTTFVWSSPNYISSYINVLKEENYGKTGTHINDLKMCFESVISQADGTACKAEVIVMYENIIIRADGSVDLNLESGGIVSADRRDSHIKALVSNKLDDDYVAEKI